MKNKRILSMMKFAGIRIFFILMLLTQSLLGGMIQPSTSSSTTIYGNNSCGEIAYAPVEYANPVYALSTVTWTDTVGTSAFGNDLTKTDPNDPPTNGGTDPLNDRDDGGAFSLECIEECADGYMEFRATEASDGAIPNKHHYVVGLGGTNQDEHFDDISYGIYIQHNDNQQTTNRFYVYELGVYKGYFGTWAEGDIFKVEKKNGVVTYQQNGVTFYTSLATPAEELCVDASIYGEDDTIFDVVIHEELCETCDGVDNDGDGLVDEETEDTDGDGVCDENDQCFPGTTFYDVSGNTTGTPGSFGYGYAVAPYNDIVDDDLDGRPNDCDICPDSATNDADGDEVCDNVDNCPGVNNPYVGGVQPDADGDGVGDACEGGEICDAIDHDGDGDAYNGLLEPGTACTYLSDPSGGTVNNICECICNDSDGDTVCDVVDICDGNDLIDNDGNGVPDDCDACPFGDMDGDGVCDDVDNCQTIFNPAVASAGSGTPAGTDLVNDNFQDGNNNAPFNLQVRNTTGNATNRVAVVVGAPYATIPGLNPGNYTLQTINNGDGTYDHIFTGTTQLNGFANITITGGLPVPPGVGKTITPPNPELYTSYTPASGGAGGGVQPDADGDGIGDACDVEQCDDFDHDGDGNNYNGFNDQDGDLVADCIDNCPAVANPGQEDNNGYLDGNGTGDVCEDCVGDSDGDGVCDTVDVCNTLSATYQTGGSEDDLLDSDSDGIADGCDFCPNTAMNDPDGDEVCNDIDNCPMVSNTDQGDADTDGIGNACDVEQCDIIDHDGDNDPYNGLTDSDSDGIPNCIDNCPTVANLGQEDNNGFQDGDGEGDVCESCAVGDSDGDGVCDTYDVCPGFDDLADADNDGIPDGCDFCPDTAMNDEDNDGTCDNIDNCVGVFNDQTNTDGDLFGDACDVEECDAIDHDGVGGPYNGFLVPTTSCDFGGNSGTVNNLCECACNDSDGDGICDDIDNCPSVSSTNQTDTDGDGIGDICDDCEDTDNDTICDLVDNCVGVPNTDQLDNSGNGVGNACDVEICNGVDDNNDGTIDEGFPSLDGDTIPDCRDNCPNHANQDQADSNGIDDNGGLGDACEEEICDGIDNDGDGVFDEGYADLDGDNIGDECDICVGTDNVDTDGDGICDSQDTCEGGDDLVDVDGDLVPDECDNCQGIANDGTLSGNVWTQEDQDKDGIGDICDIELCDLEDNNGVNGNNEGFDDSDGDGRANCIDNCPTVVNPGQEDVNGIDDVPGTAGDACELCPAGDDDLDGVCNTFDQCNVSTPTFITGSSEDDDDDADGDGIPDGCDECPNGVDADGDDVCDSIDNCLGVANTDQANVDGDTLGDACDVEVCDMVDHDGDGDNYNGFLTPGEVCDFGGFTGTVNGVCECYCNDSDGDGICDDIDNCPSISSTNQTDTDGDGIGDICDDCEDTDNDTICDLVDNCVGVPNTDQTNQDGDQFGDACDACVVGDADFDNICDDIDSCTPATAYTGSNVPSFPGLSTSNLADADFDGIPNACDPCPTDFMNDMDGDGICEVIDNCDMVANPDQADNNNFEDNFGLGDACESCSGDLDGDGFCDNIDVCDADSGTIENTTLGTSDAQDADNDGLPDACDVCPFDHLLTHDLDGDGVVICNDNCPAIANPNQTDANGIDDNNAEGDACEACPDGDIDNDGVCNSADICDINNGAIQDVTIASDDTIDTDNDGVPNACDICQLGEDSIDTDNDGTPDDCDVCPFDINDDSDGDGVCDSVDLCFDGTTNYDVTGNTSAFGNGYAVAPYNDIVDDDLDGRPNDCDICPDSATNDSDGDEVCDNLDICLGADDNLDTDQDGTPDCLDICPLDANNDSDGDGSCDTDDICGLGDDALDFDMDGIPDACDTCPSDFDSSVISSDTDGDNICNSDDICGLGDDAIDSDGDLVPDACDICPDDATDDSDGDGVCDSIDVCNGFDDAVDTDGDGVANGCDTCPDDATDDSDGDGICDSADVCPNDNPDDSDSDGVCDSDDICNEVLYPAAAGMNTSDLLDFDGDLVPDACDICPLSYFDDTDGDTVCDDVDICIGDDLADADSDGIPDACDVCPQDDQNDADGDGVCGDVDVCPGADDNLDTDLDGVANCLDTCPDDEFDDSDGDGVCDSADICPDDFTNDTDGDGICDGVDICVGNDNQDGDGDGTPDDCDVCPMDYFNDSDGDGSCDSDDICEVGDDTVDADEDGVPDACDACPNGDADGDGVCDDADVCPAGDDTIDTDNDGVPNACDVCQLGEDGIDTDGDGVADDCDICPRDPNDDSDGDLVCDSDDICEGGDDAVDQDGDGIPDTCDVCPLSAPNDADSDGVCDNVDICLAGDDAIDSDGDSIPDACDDCLVGDDDEDGVCNTIDVCENGDDTIDQDNDGIPDACDACPLGFDTDEDGVCDNVDNCPENPNPGQEDNNGFGDGIGPGDACEADVCDGIDNDGDGIVDNDHIDTDQDGVADCVDTTPDGGSCVLGAVCSDGSDDTVIDVYNSACECVGEPYEISIVDPYECAGPIEGQVTKSDNLDITTVEVKLSVDGVTEYTFILLPEDINADGSYEIPVDYIDTDSEFYVADAMYELSYIVTTNQGPSAAGSYETRITQFCDAEICDGVDNDQDGVIDEGFTNDDGDNHGNSCDNCPDEINNDQEDSDQDGIGNVCDVCPDDAGNDADDDGVCEAVDNCPTWPNPDQADDDNDGIGDACDDDRAGNSSSNNRGSSSSNSGGGSSSSSRSGSSGSSRSSTVNVFGVVYHDINDDDEYIAEPGVAGISVELLDASGVVIGTTLTSANGSYSFSAKPGNYSVRYTNNSSLTSDSDNDGADVTTIGLGTLFAGNSSYNNNFGLIGEVLEVVEADVIEVVEEAVDESFLLVETDLTVVESIIELKEEIRLDEIAQEFGSAQLQNDSDGINSLELPTFLPQTGVSL